VVRQGLIAYLDRHGRFEVVAEAGSCAEAISQVRKFVPDLVLMDVRLPDATGIEACRLIQDEFPGMPVVFLTSSPEDVDVLAAVVAGARGYVLKQSHSAELVRTLEAVMGAVLERIRRIASDPGSEGANDLTVREREILPLIAEGKSNKEIAGGLFLSDKTVKNYVSSILGKLGLTRRTQIPVFLADRDGQHVER
jgi:DNA-binding NarL/FixJ family response regulator